jgi:hypothetical protein
LLSRFFSREPEPTPEFLALKEKAKLWRERLKTCLENVGGLGNLPEVEALRFLVTNHARQSDRFLEGKSLAEAQKVIALVDFLWECILELSPTLNELSSEMASSQFVARMEVLETKKFVLPAHSIGLFERGLLEGPMRGEERMGLEQFLKLLEERYVQARDLLRSFHNIQNKTREKFMLLRQMEGDEEQIVALENLVSRDPLSAWEGVCALEAEIVKEKAQKTVVLSTFDSAMLGLSVLNKKTENIRDISSLEEARKSLRKLEEWLGHIHQRAILTKRWVCAKHGLQNWNTAALLLDKRLDEIKHIEESRL